MKIMLCILVLASILTDVFAETGAEKKVPYAIITSGNMLDNILRLQSMVNNMSWELKATTSDLRTTKVALKNTEDKLNSALSELSRLDVLNKRIEEIAKKTELTMVKSEIVFQAKQLRNPYHPSKFEPLKFDDVSLNKGGGYNPSSGIFTVPRTGIYVCLANVLPAHHNYFGVRLVNEGKTLVEGYAGSGSRQGASSIGYLTPFKKGDHVWFDINEGNTFEIEGAHQSSYGCYLMYE